MTNTMQERQNQVPCEIIIRGIEDWKECLAEKIKLHPMPLGMVYRDHPNMPVVDWAALHGSTDTIEVSLFDHLKKVAELNRDSFERELICNLLTKGYQLEELEVQFWGGGEGENWGKCVWYKEHSNYTPFDPE